MSQKVWGRHAPRSQGGSGGRAAHLGVLARIVLFVFLIVQGVFTYNPIFGPYMFPFKYFVWTFVWTVVWTFAWTFVAPRSLSSSHLCLCMLLENIDTKLFSTNIKSTIKRALLTTTTTATKCFCYLISYNSVAFFSFLCVFPFDCLCNYSHIHSHSQLLVLQLCCQQSQCNYLCFSLSQITRQHVGHMCYYYYHVSMFCARVQCLLLTYFDAHSRFHV